jgi:iron complex transport system substrate-binding protein
MKNMKKILIINLLFLSGTFLYADNNTREIADSTGRMITIPQNINRIICSGAGSLRLITYMQAEKLVTGVDDIEKRDNPFDARVYALANPQFKKLPLIGEFRGFDNPELILKLNPAPDVIFKVYSISGHDAAELQNKTGIPVIVLKYGDLSFNKGDLFNSLKIIGKTLNKEKRSEEVITFINSSIDDLNKRTANIPDNKKKSCFIGGVSQAGSHGFNSTEPAYSPFKMLNAKNVAFDKSKNPKELAHAYISKEKIVEWDPEIIFIDLGTLQTKEKGNGLFEIKTDSVYKELTAVKKGEVYGLLPYNYYSTNFESVIADAYYIGKLLYPEKFKDISAEKKADEIYSFFVGKPVYKELDKFYEGLSFKKILLK